MRGTLESMVQLLSTSPLPKAQRYSHEDIMKTGSLFPRFLFSPKLPLRKRVLSAALSFYQNICENKKHIALLAFWGRIDCTMISRSSSEFCPSTGMNNFEKKTFPNSAETGSNKSWCPEMMISTKNPETPLGHSARFLLSQWGLLTSTQKQDKYVCIHVHLAYKWYYMPTKETSKLPVTCQQNKHHHASSPRHRMKATFVSLPWQRKKSPPPLVSDAEWQQSHR